MDNTLLPFAPIIINNPQGLDYLSNMYDFGAERSANEIFHSWFNDGTDWDNALTSLYGPAPGFSYQIVVKDETGAVLYSQKVVKIGE